MIAGGERGVQEMTTGVGKAAIHKEGSDTQQAEKGHGQVSTK